MSLPRKGNSLQPSSRARQRARASWIFSSVLLGFLMVVVWFAPEQLAGFKQQIVRLFAALLAGLMVFFLTGDLSIERSGRLKASSELGAFALILLLWPMLVPALSPDLYRLRVTVLGTQGQPVDDAEVRSNIGGEKKRVEGGWEVDIPADTLPVGRKITVYAEKPSAFLRGSRDITLDKEFQPAVSIALREDHSAMVQGRVQDEKGNSLPGARVSVTGYEAESVTTGAEGGFLLAAHAALGQTIELHAEKQGFLAIDQGHLAGNGPATLVLERK